MTLSNCMSNPNQYAFVLRTKERERENNIDKHNSSILIENKIRSMVNYSSLSIFDRYQANTAEEIPSKFFFFFLFNSKSSAKRQLVKYATT